MKKTRQNITSYFFTLTIVLTLMIGCNFTDRKGDIQTGTQVKPLTYREMIGKPLIMDFGDSVIYEVTFKSDSTLFWKTPTNEFNGDEKSITIILDEYRILTHWIEKDSNVVSLLTDFKAMSVKGYETFKTFETIPLIGKLETKH